jgi:hypothetical protein
MDESVASFVSRYTTAGLTGMPATPDEVESLERRLGIVFPAAYRAFLLILGRDGGPHFAGTDCTIQHLPHLRKAAEELLSTCCSPFRLPEKAVVFLMHQGYVFAYFLADNESADPPVFLYREGESKPEKIAETFTTWLQL